MSTGSTASTYKTVLGIAKEPQPATGTPVAATDFIPVTKFDPANKVAKLIDGAWRGSMTEEYGVVNGPRSSEVSLSGPAFLDTIGYLVAGMLGDVVTTGTATTPTGTLSAGSLVGATSVSSSVSIPNGTIIQIDVGALAEIVTTSGPPTGTGPFTIPVPALKNAHLSGVAITAVIAPFTHGMALLNSGNCQPTSYSITDSNAVSTRLYASSRFTELTLKYDAAALLTYDAKTLGWASATGSVPAASYSTLPVVPSWQATVNIAGTPNVTLTSYELAIKRNNSEAIMTFQNTMDPYEVHVGPLAVETKWTAVAADESMYTDYVNATQRAWVVDLVSGTTELKFQMTNTQHTDVTMQRGKSFIEFQGTSKAVANTTDIGASAGFSPILASVKNAKPAGTFA